MNSDNQHRVRGLLNYADKQRIPGDGFRFNFDPQWSGIPVVEKTVDITDAASLTDAPEFTREGFEKVELGIDPIDPGDSKAIEQVWRPAVVRAVQQLTVADAVASWACGVRYSERQVDAPRSDVSNPARRIHGDFAPSEFGEKIQHGLARDAIYAVAEGRVPVRWIGLNVWQSLTPPPYDIPLAFCDSRTVSPADLVVGRGSSPSMPEIEIDLPLFCHADRHRWYYWSQTSPGEALVFRGLDSSMPGNWGLVPHTAFDNPECTADSIPRISMEMRCMALYFE